MGVCLEWRRWIRPLIIFAYILVLLVALPFLIVQLQQQKVRADKQIIWIGGVFVFLAIPISLWGILQHCVHYTQPLLQRYIIRYAILLSF